MALASPDTTELLPLHVTHGTADAELHELRVAGDRVERRPQLVRHHREELRLRPVRRLGLGARRLLGREQPGAFERLRALLSERARERDVAFVERATRLEA